MPRKLAFLSLTLALALPALRVSAETVDGLALPFKSVTISSPVQEIVAEINVEEGDTVKKDEPLARLRDEKEKIEFRKYAAVLEKRKFDYEASQNLLKDKILSKEQALAAGAELELAQVDFELAKNLLEEKTILSPLDGTVVKKHLEAGESVDRVQPLFEIVNIDQLFLQFFLEPRFVTNLKEGDEVKFTLVGHADTVYTAVIDFISPSADAGSGLFRVKLLFDNTGNRIKAGLRVAAEFGD